jgi:hypothetical protein
VSRAAGYAAAAAAIVAALSWIDPLFLPLVLLGPPLSGGTTGWFGAPLRWIAATWALAGLLMAVSDLVVNREDVVFHIALAAIMAALASAAWYAGRFAGRRWA